MKKFIILIFILFSIFVAGRIFNIFLASAEESGTGDVKISVKVSGWCGNGIKESGEQCDGSDLGGETCVSLGYLGGTLKCNPDCTFDTSACTSGGGGGGGYVPPVVTKVILKGKAYPGSNVYILKDGKLIAVTKSDSNADFEQTITDITPGIYSFSIWAKDKDGIKSITYTITFRVAPQAITTVSGIFLPPTISIDKEGLKRGEILDIFGQTVPRVEVEVNIMSKEIVATATSDEIGAWLYKFNTEPLEEGSHTVKARFQLNVHERSGFGQVLSFYIGKAVPPWVNLVCPYADLNKDGKINLVDFSILLYWWGKKNACADQNMNGVVDLPDFSIMMFYWTG